ncbi:bifunctional UDP-N-acetylglucosamine diphosphorylase/glucosamine-1-phosphate N-acetyltransferase GlmU [bacterium]|nr:bifunctional UDP-N-acetylglucosamine diphosphorylase/glucosamine-1-phosphate N-acetyltransferase GlmU [bacterium]MBU1025868.1 bifunctional UDP-N-acetylglucosamine diphosphorylase/glucosamine-1-phosphate N-acetyltransferase GlmU [bacterium]
MVKTGKINKKKILALVLMAGRGTRMKSDTPKVLHKILGKPMGWYVLNALEKAGINRRLIVVGYRADLVKNAFPKEKFVLQEPQDGTGHAVMVSRKSIPNDITHILVINGDTPLLTSTAVNGLIGQLGKDKCRAVVSAEWSFNPESLGRIITDDSGNFIAIREHRDLKPSEKNIEWYNPGLYGFEKKSLLAYLDKLGKSNRQKELYLTDIPGMMARDNQKVEIYTTKDESFTVLPNDRIDIADATAMIQNRILNNLMKKGVTITVPERVYIEHDVTISRDTVIHPESYLMGNTSIGKNSVIGPNVTIADSKIGKNVQISMSSLEEARVDDNCVVGPYSHLRPGVYLKKGAKVGNFCEIKKSIIGEGSKINHLSYIGDATIGKNVNIGAGTITCNYDGTLKHRTIIGDNAFIGSDSILVAPVKIGAGTLTGAGSVITRDVPDGQVVMGVPARVVRKVTRKDKSGK